ncbi:hypothetical protein SEA_OHGEESY_31 [Gordonia phage Ohgeesy]|uniref:Uncharacterized protein n=1 Tax=Gordonia phage Ohgeesy TaxID=2762412 RepID=A0A7G8LG88_9CAUD|nr:hypothetical protein PP492_gp31 [Gordonia phage Ohgeesy]QNJ56260.1 hypothetical protein SEA_OHGEESY_31 [Gordonia phage Ohgeesy]
MAKIESGTGFWLHTPRDVDPRSPSWFNANVGYQIEDGVLRLYFVTTTEHEADKYGSEQTTSNELMAVYGPGGWLKLDFTRGEPQGT